MFNNNFCVYKNVTLIVDSPQPNPHFPFTEEEYSNEFPPEDPDVKLVDHSDLYVLDLGWYKLRLLL